MTTNRKIQRDDVLRAALELLKIEDIDALTARQIASLLDCSVQPIFYNFENMEELKTAAIAAVHDIYVSYMNAGAAAPSAYKGMGLAYIRFARDYPNYFQLLFMRESNLSPESFICEDDSSNEIIRHGMEMTGFSEEVQRPFHLKVWIFTHGLATLVANGTVRFTDAEIERLLTETVRALVVGMKHQPGSSHHRPNSAPDRN